MPKAFIEKKIIYKVKKKKVNIGIGQTLARLYLSFTNSANKLVSLILALSILLAIAIGDISGGLFGDFDLDFIVFPLDLDRDFRSLVDELGFCNIGDCGLNDLLDTRLVLKYLKKIH